jgi:hypothetical protein
MPEWSPVDLLPGLYLALLFVLLNAALRHWYDPVPALVRAAFAAALLVLFGPVLFGGKILLPLDDLRGQAPFRQLAPTVPHGNPLQGDLITLVAPSAVAVRAAWREGRWPLWNSRVGAGIPLLADPQAQALQPLVLAGYPLPYPRAAGVTAALRVLVALTFTFLLLRRQGLAAGSAAAGAFAFGLGGFVLLWVGWPLANAAALLPLLLYALVRCDQVGGRSDHFLLCAAATAILLAGHPETIAYALALAALFLADLLRHRPAGTRRTLLRDAALALVVAAGIAGPHLLPAAHALPRSLRAASLTAPTAAATTDTAGGYTARLLPIAAPNAFGNSRFNDYWGAHNTNEDASGFAGTATLLVVLVSLAARRRFPQEGAIAVATAAGLFVLARPPFVERLLTSLPAAHAVATPRLGLVVGFGLAYLGACGLEHLRRGDLPGGRIAQTIVVLMAAAALAVLLAWGYLAHPFPGDPARMAIFRFGWLRWQLRFLTAAALALVLLPRRRLKPLATAATAGVAVLVAAELLLVHGPANPASPRRLAFPENAATRFLEAHLGFDRMAALGPAFPPDLPSLYRLADVRAYNPMAPWDYVQATAPITTAWKGEVPELGHPADPLYGRLGVHYLLVAPETGCPPPSRVVLADASARICELPAPRGPLFLVPAPAAGAGVTITALTAARIAAWVGDPAEASRPGRPLSRLVASTIYQDGGWHSIVDGLPRPPARALGPFAAARVTGPKNGRAVSRVELIYRPAGHLAGCLAAALALALGAACWCPPPRI